MQRKLSRTLPLFGLAVFLLSFVFHLTFYWRRDLHQGKLFSIWVEEVPPPKSPLIILWSSYFSMEGDKALKFLSVDRTQGEGCHFTGDRSRLEEADAILFHLWPGDLRRDRLPRWKRDPGQVWVLFGQESPELTPKGPELDRWRGLFNWTMTYRLDSDVEATYGRVEEGREEGEIEEIFQGKRDLVVGVMSKCRTFSRREELVAQLNHSIPVKIFGHCGEPIVKPGSPAEASFWRGLGAKYKFYLAFENALCVDYITEKFWRALRLGMVPVVYGGANYSKVAPPNSYVNARDFPSPKALAKHLLKLDGNPEEYGKYFEWRKTHKVRQEPGRIWRNLCRKLKQFKWDGGGEGKAMGT